MLQALAFGLGFGAAFQAWRNYPADGPVTASAAAVCIGLGVLCAYLGGRWHGRGRGSAHATATATASAQAAASNTVQVAVIVPGHGPSENRGVSDGGVQIPTERAPWLAGTHVRPEITADDLEGMELADIFQAETEYDYGDTTERS